MKTGSFLGCKEVVGIEPPPLFFWIKAPQKLPCPGGTGLLSTVLRVLEAGGKGISTGLLETGGGSMKGNA